MCAAPLSGCCLATLKLRVSGDGELFDEQGKVKWSGGAAEVKRLHSEEVKQLLRRRLLSPSRRRGDRVTAANACLKSPRPQQGNLCTWKRRRGRG